MTLGHRPMYTFTGWFGGAQNIYSKLKNKDKNLNPHLQAVGSIILHII